MRRKGLWLLLGMYFLIASATTESLYMLTAPATYVAFSGDLHVQYSIPSNVSLPNAFIRLVSLKTSKKPVEITTLSVPLGVSASQLPVTCGIIEYAGDFAFRLYMHSDSAMLAERLLTVVWPKVDITIPEDHVALTKDVSVVIKSQARCSSLLHRYALRLDLVHLGSNASSQGSSRSDISYSESLPMFTDSNVIRTFPCYAFDYVGSYQVLYKSSYNSGSVIARSNILRATWSRNYHINFYSNAVFPCNGARAVLYTQPECPGQEDKIRMFSMVRSTSGSPAAPIEYVYVAERRAVGKNEHVSFDCDLFKEDVTGYCFAYVSIARSGAVMEQKRFCVPAKDDAVMPIDGAWSEWSSWGECKASCGNGKMNRYRYCNSPAPAHGGRFCMGDTVEWKPCVVHCEESINLTPLHSPRIDPDCACGCTMTSESENIIATGRCQGLSKWLISLEPNMKIKLTFHYFSLYENKQWVKIRNGKDSNGDLLAISSGVVSPSDVTSTSNHMLVEFMSMSSASSTSTGSTYPSKPLKEIHVHGFIASYIAIADNSTSTTIAAYRTNLPSNTVWESSVTVIGILVCVFVVIVAVGVVLYRRWNQKKRHKYTLASKESPAHRSSSMPSSPDIVPDIEANDVQTPLAFEPKKKESAFVALISRGSSISSNASVGLKKFRSKSEMDPGGSPKPSPRNYTPLSSPYEANAFPSDYVHGGDVFKVSPRLKRPIPRSPKVHPSSKSHRHSHSSSGKRDKHGDSSRRVERNCAERVVLDCPEDVPELSSSLVVHVDQSARPKTHKKSSHKFDTSYGKHRRKSRTPDKSKTVCKEGEDITLNPMDESVYKKSKRRHKSGSKEKHAETAMVNSESTVPLLNDLSGSKQQQTKEFIARDNKPRRPVSLTESYSAGVPHAKGHHVVGNGHGPPKTPKNKPDGNSESDRTITDQRSLVLPKPDGQSPELIKDETVQSKSSTPISIISNRTLSPSKSIATPSECLELEYDDFIFEDPTSYLDPYETVKFQWQGVEKMGKINTENAITPNGPTAKLDSPAS